MECTTAKLQKSDYQGLTPMDADPMDAQKSCKTIDAISFQVVYICTKNANSHPPLGAMYVHAHSITI